MKTSNKILLAFFFSFAFAGAAEGLAPVNAEWLFAFSIFHMFLISIMLFSWCGAHAKENQIIPPSGAKLLVAFIAPIGVPYYFLGRYGMKQGLFKTVKSILFYALCIGIYSGLFYVSQNA
jgi:hypothetical protein